MDRILTQRSLTLAALKTPISDWQHAVTGADQKLPSQSRQQAQSLQAEPGYQQQTQTTSPQCVDCLCQLALLLPGPELILERQALWRVPAVQAELADAQNGGAQGQRPGFV